MLAPSGGPGVGGPGGGLAGRGGVQLLCNLRSILRKLHKHVLVGDYVQVGNVDWNTSRGTVVDLLERSSEVRDPAVANVDHALLVFALNDPPVSGGARV